jgi:GT2 family glycosyltransferase
VDYVFVCNSDVLFEKDLFESIIKVDYKGIGAISPMVYNQNGEHQIPVVATNNIYNEVILTAITVFLSWLYPPLIMFLCRLPKQVNWLLSKKSFPCVWIRQKYVIQGCSYFLTPEFFRFYLQLYPKTFLYGEEINLLVYLKKAKLTSLMIETSPVIHKQNGSSRIVFGPILEQKKLELNTSSLIKSLPMFLMRYTTIKKRYH